MGEIALCALVWANFNLKIKQIAKTLNFNISSFELCLCLFVFGYIFQQMFETKRASKVFAWFGIPTPLSTLCWALRRLFVYRVHAKATNSTSYFQICSVRLFPSSKVTMTWSQSCFMTIAMPVVSSKKRQAIRTWPMNILCQVERWLNLNNTRRIWRASDIRGRRFEMQRQTIQVNSLLSVTINF